MLRDDFLIFYGSINTQSTMQPHAVSYHCGSTPWQVAHSGCS